MTELSDKQVKAAELLAAGWLCKDVAKELEVTPETISHWKQNVHFIAYYNRCRKEASESAMEALRSSAGSAAKALGSLVAGARSEETKRKAARDILELLGYDDIQQLAMRSAVGGTTPEEVADELSCRNK